MDSQVVKRARLDISALYNYNEQRDLVGEGTYGCVYKAKEKQTQVQERNTGSQC